MFTSLAQSAVALPALSVPLTVFDRINSLAADTLTTLRIVVVVIGVFFVLGVMISTRMRLVPVVVAGLTAAIAVWIVFNIDTVEGIVDDTITGTDVQGMAPEETPHVHDTADDLPVADVPRADVPGVTST